MLFVWLRLPQPWHVVRLVAVGSGQRVVDSGRSRQCRPCRQLGDTLLSVGMRDDELDGYSRRERTHLGQWTWRRRR